MMDGLTIEKVKLTLDARLRIMETAVDAGHTHGIGYWADVVQIKHTTLVGSEEKRIGELCLHDREGAGEPDLTILGKNNALIPGGGQGKGGRLWLNGEVIERAVQRMLADPKGTDCLGWDEQMITHDVEDGPLADAIIQVACFGKVIYG